jgi:hypothetical protein
MNQKSILVLAAAAALLTGCLIPEKFAAKADFQPDGSYTFSYNGSVVHGMAAMALAKTGKLSAKDDAALEQEAANLKRSSDVHAVAYKGNGRYDLALDAKRNKGQALDVQGIVSIKTGNDGVTTISAPEIDEKSRKNLSQLGIKIDGALEVTIPKNAEVISHNATSASKSFGLASTYSWKIGSIDQRPMMTFRLK